MGELADALHIGCVLESELILTIFKGGGKVVLVGGEHLFIIMSM